MGREWLLQASGRAGHYKTAPFWMLDSWWVTTIQKNYLKGNVCVSATSVIFHACQGCFVRTLTITLVHRAFQSVNPSQSTVEYRSMCCRCVTQTAKAAVMGCSVPCTVVMTALMLCVILNHTRRTCFVFVGGLEVRAAGVPGVTHGEASQRYTLMVRTSAGADPGGSMGPVDPFHYHWFLGFVM